LDETLKVRGAKGVIRRNQQGLYGLLLENLTPFLLDPRFEFAKTYWLFTGISGADPEVASVGSAAWARWVTGRRLRGKLSRWRTGGARVAEGLEPQPDRGSASAILGAW
jgi:hypothetical protein